MEEYLVVGIVERKGKTGRLWTTLYLQCDMDAYSKENSERCEGVKVVVESTGAELPILHIGDTVQLLYTKGFEDKAVLGGVVVVKTNPVTGSNNAKK